MIKNKHFFYIKNKVKANMKKLKVKLTRGGEDYRAVIAVCSGTPIEEFLSLLKSSLSIPDAVIVGFKDSEGVLLIPSLIFSDPELIGSDDYELLYREKASSIRQDDQYAHIISEIRAKNELNEEEYFTLRT